MSTPPDHDLDSGSGGDDGPSRLDRFWRWVWRWVPSARAKRIERYREREESTWLAESAELRNLVWLLRLQHAEADARRAGAQWQGHAMTMMGCGTLAVALKLIVESWAHLAPLAQVQVLDAVVRVPWEIGVPTTAAVLLLGGAASLMFNVARDGYARAALQNAEMDKVRRIEAAMRLALSSDNMGERGAEVLRGVGARLLAEPTPSTDGAPAELTALPLLDSARKLISETFESIGKLKG